MIRRKFTSKIIYIFFSVFIFSWWLIALKSPNKDPITYNETLNQSRSQKITTHFLNYLSPINRDSLKQALSGDTKIMTQLISEWDIDAQILESNGIVGAKRLARKDYIRSQILGRQINIGSKENTEEITLQDATGKTLQLNPGASRFLPQSYMSATFLLSLIKPDRIVALPHGLRDQTELFPPALTKQIQLDTNRFNSEALHLANPDIAFVASFSDPMTLQTLSNQGINLFTLKAPETILDITEALNQVGKITHKANEAELLSLFMESALLAIDNQLLAAHYKLDQKPKLLYLNYHTSYSVPSQRTLTGKLLNRLDETFVTYKGKQNFSSDWMVPVDQENILNFNPDYLIVSSSHKEAVLNQISASSALSQINAIKNNQISCVDVDIQLSPTHYIILAYYDIMQSLL